MNRKSEEIKEKQISEVMLSIENRVRHAYNQGYEQGLKASKQEPCEDCISRQAVLDKLNRLIEVERLQGSDEMGYGRERVSAYECMIDEVESEFLYPSVQPKPKTGHWSRKTKVDTYDIEGVKTWGIKCQCDRCDFTTIVVEDFGYYKYCPNCGARMEGGNEEE